ncbi:type I DNA topoisomerase, partial [Candidatus Saccharibacteria bacterium]|nr:type I DNA topoisomerase [Candidatus Saccharibacteria bacterium]
MSEKSINNLVIVESPAKAHTIAGYLGKDFKVMSSVGHIRSIAKKPVKGVEPIDTDHEFATIYEIDPDKKKTVAELKSAVKSAKTVWLATDEDREGEAIAWHLCEVLGLNPATTNRIVFHEITKNAIAEAIENPRHVDMSLVKAQQARQILDRLVGFELSPVVWRKVPGGKSAGRVQSPAVRLLVEREREIADFESSFVFKVTGEFSTCHHNPAPCHPGEGEMIRESLLSMGHEPEEPKAILVSGSPGGSDEIPKQVRNDNDITIKATLSTDLPDEAAAQDFLNSLTDAKFTVADVENSTGTRSPLPPFTTSTLQQDANARLGMSARTTMALAQQLYQSGLITYMRTDSLNLSGQALAQMSTYIKNNFGEKYAQVRKYHTKSAGAQEAHEAIRPTDATREIAGDDPRAQKLYDLIRRRTLASQMANAKIERSTATIAISDHSEIFTAKGEVVIFDGFLKMYGASKDEILPELHAGDTLNATEITARQTFARPPARYTEGSLVKKLEELGIGRPSTYASIIDTIQRRGYAERGASDGVEREIIELKLSTCHSELVEESSRDKKRSLDAARDDNHITRQILTEKTGATKGKLIPTPSGSVVSDFLGEHFTDIVDYDFTARIENELDEIAEDKLDKTKMLSDFYDPFHAQIDRSASIERSAVAGMRELGIDPKSGEPVFARVGRFG